MSEAFIRTEDIDPKEVKSFFVETDNDRDIINSLKGTQPLLLVGSRGTGKTMLLRVAEQELTNEFNKERVLPVFVNLVTCNIHDSSDLLKILISRTLIGLQHSLKSNGILLSGSIFKPITDIKINPIVSKLEKYINETSTDSSGENSIEINNDLIRTDTAKLIDFLFDLCNEFNIKRIVFFFDEACQVFQPTQQRIFFDFFRSLRTYYIVCKAAVYPGIVTYGTFQKFHDATVKKIERSISSSDYVSQMRQIIEKHYPTDYNTLIEHGDLLDSLVYASSGNPRFLLKSINEIFLKYKKFNTQNLNNIIKEFYGTTIWSEHIKLGNIYSGHKDMIDWSRNFIEDKVLEDIAKINLDPKTKDTVYFAISRNAPEVIKQTIKTLEYSGVISIHTEGTRYRTEMYDRYEINLGIVVLKEKQVVIQKRIKEIVDNLSLKVFPNYSSNSSSYGNYDHLKDISKFEADYNEVMNEMMKKSISILDISPSLQKRLSNNGLNTIGEVLNRNESDLQKIPYIGPVRSRKISNIVYNSILEYISG